MCVFVCMFKVLNKEIRDYRNQFLHLTKNSWICIFQNYSCPTRLYRSIWILSRCTLYSRIRPYTCIVSILNFFPNIPKQNIIDFPTIPFLKICKNMIVIAVIYLKDKMERGPSCDDCRCCFPTRKITQSEWVIIAIHRSILILHLSRWGNECNHKWYWQEKTHYDPCNGMESTSTNSLLPNAQIRRLQIADFSPCALGLRRQNH